MMHSFFRQPRTIIRTTAGSWVLGVWTPGAEQAPFTIQGSWQPASQEDLEILPQGTTRTGVFKLITDAALVCAMEGDTAISDQIEQDGSRYRVTAVIPWANNIINSNQYLCTRILESADE